MICVYRDIKQSTVLVGSIDETDQDPTFRYDEAYLRNPDAAAISMSLPLVKRQFNEDEFKPYFDGLLPEGRSRIALAADLGLSERDYLQLLARCGLDCIGDVIIDRDQYHETRAFEAIDYSEISQLGAGSIKAVDMQAANRLSLAGVQDKCALYHDEAQRLEHGWYRPVGGAPSTHIIKYASEELPDLMLIEYLCLMAAEGCGLLVPQTQMLDFERPTICSKRYDRLISDTATIDGLPLPIRLHQEDMSQAMGIVSTSKYMELYPNSVTAIAEFLRRNLVHPGLDITEFARKICFDYAIGNCDNHLKNISILYSPTWQQKALAPTYDVICTTYYERFSKTMGMAIGSNRQIDNVSPDDFVLLAKQLSISPLAIVDIARRIDDNLISSLTKAATDLDKRGFKLAHYISDNIIEDAVKRLKVLHDFIG